MATGGCAWCDGAAAVCPEYIFPIGNRWINDIMFIVIVYQYFYDYFRWYAGPFGDGILRIAKQNGKKIIWKRETTHYVLYFCMRMSSSSSRAMNIIIITGFTRARLPKKNPCEWPNRTTWHPTHFLALITRLHLSVIEILGSVACQKMTRIHCHSFIMISDLVIGHSSIGINFWCILRAHRSTEFQMTAVSFFACENCVCVLCMIARALNNMIRNAFALIYETAAYHHHHHRLNITKYIAIHSLAAIYTTHTQRWHFSAWNSVGF